MVQRQPLDVDQKHFQAVKKKVDKNLTDNYSISNISFFKIIRLYFTIVYFSLWSVFRLGRLFTRTGIPKAKDKEPEPRANEPESEPRV